MSNVTGTKPQGVVRPSAETEWIPFPGGELEGRPARVACRACLEQRDRGAEPRQSADKPGDASASTDKAAHPRRSAAPLCFACYRADLARERAIKAAGELDTATDARFQSVLPLEPVDRARLFRLRAERAIARTARDTRADRYVDKRRHAQIAARHALQQIGAGLRQRNLTNAFGTIGGSSANAPERGAQYSWRGGQDRTSSDSLEWSALHAAELQFPEAWLPFVTAR